MLRLGEERTYYVDDGCQTNDEDSPVPSYYGTFLPKSSTAGALCCNGTADVSCIAVPEDYSCTENATIYDEAYNYCKEKGNRLCTKSELLSNICCGVGGNCDNHPVWTSSTNTGR